MTTPRIRVGCGPYIRALVVVLVWVHTLAVERAAGSSSISFHPSPSSSSPLNIFETLPHQVVRVIRLHQWRSDLICRGWVGLLSPFDESAVTPTDSLTAWYHPPQSHPHRWQYQQQFKLNQVNTIIQLHPSYHHQQSTTRELTRSFSTRSSDRTQTEADWKWLIQVACHERTRSGHVKRVPIEPAHGILTYDDPDAESILHFLLTPSPPPGLSSTSSLESTLRQCPSPPEWLITLREWWFENWREIYDEMMEWRWLQGWWIVKEALTASITPRKEYQEWLLQVLHHQAFISIYTFMRESLHDLKCCIYFFFSFIDTILPSASTLRFVFQLAFLHVIVIAYLLYRHQYPSQPQQNLEAPSTVDSEDHKDEERKEGGARLGSWSRNLQTWKEPLAAWMEVSKAPTPTTSSSSTSRMQPPETAADQIRRRMREEADAEEAERRSTLSSLIQTSAMSPSTTDSSTAAEAPKISFTQIPTPTPSSSSYPSPSVSHEPMLPRHVSASHIITPLIPISPFSATRHLPTTNIPSSLPFGRSILHPPTSSRPSSPSASSSSTASTPTSQTNLRPFAFRTPPLPETTTMTEESTTTTSPSHSTTAPAEEQYDDLGPNI